MLSIPLVLYYLWLCFTLLILLTASDYALEEEAREYVNMVNLEGNNSVGEYSYSENQQDLQEYVPETETVHEEPPLEEEPYTLQNNVEALEVPEPSWEEPAGEQSKLSYASIVCIPYIFNFNAPYI